MQLWRLAKQGQNLPGKEYHRQNGTPWVWAETELHVLISFLHSLLFLLLSPSSSFLIAFALYLSFSSGKTQFCFKDELSGSGGKFLPKDDVSVGVP